MDEATTFYNLNIIDIVSLQETYDIHLAPVSKVITGYCLVSRLRDDEYGGVAFAFCNGITFRKLNFDPEHEIQTLNTKPTNQSIIKEDLNAKAITFGKSVNVAKGNILVNSNCNNDFRPLNNGEITSGYITIKCRSHVLELGNT
ncbi:unnamed protein product [Hermetia illucens]|uniref:Uncharacterized protein n=1 Tax=Hermetia illucens TaxID=343691 RepID=A0A7R8USG2_HERIL|nr:unnamed protein product [Hermetia illucens]